MQIMIEKGVTYIESLRSTDLMYGAANDNYKPAVLMEVVDRRPYDKHTWRKSSFDYPDEIPITSTRAAACRLHVSQQTFWRVSVLDYSECSS
ncbi:hypothetical protein TNCV_3470261 [Trichonephila clavipes]|nr:hypothetical protein TNCV_3470261 [Trichonephila clavipes]